MKKFFKTLWIFLTFIPSTLSFASNQILYFGGGGEAICIPGSPNAKNQPPECESTVFDRTLFFMGQKAKLATKWNYQVAFDGNHRITQGIVSSNFPQSPPISKGIIEQYLDELKAKIELGDIDNKNQIIIVIDSHGAIHTNNQQTHSVAISTDEAHNLDTLNGSDLFNLDKLKDIIKLTQKKGINLGIKDLSCHSGISMELLGNNDKTCIITSTSPDHYAYSGPSGFSENFITSLTPGTSLEQAFLKARAQSKEPEFPMISTKEGLETFAELYKPISSLFYYNSNVESKLPDYIAEMNQRNECIHQEQFSKLIEEIDYLISISNATLKARLKNFKNLVSKYHQIQKELIEQEKKIGGSKLRTSEKFFAPINTKPPSMFSIEFTWQELVSQELDSTIEILENTKRKLKNPNEIAQMNATINVYKQALAKKIEILTKYPQIKDHRTATLNLVKKIGSTKELSQQIAQEEKIIFDELYKTKQSLNFDDPCRKIVF